MTWATIVVGLLSGAPAFLRWWRVAQREHYLAGSAGRFAVRWWIRTAPNPFVLAVSVAGIVLSWWWTPAGWIGAVVAGSGPVGLGVRGRTSDLAWTARLRKIAVASGAVFVGMTTAGALVSSGLVAVSVLLVPLWVDLALGVLAPIERRSGDRWVGRAATALDRSGARVVAITGSYGKTSTKVITAHLLSHIATTVASPASFNNRMGLARAINEGLVPGTEVFVAEMGTYGAGEIAELCSWIPPEVAVMTAIGPVHLERMGSEEAIASAKREILAEAKVGVVNVDHRLLRLVATEEGKRIRVIRCSSVDVEAEVYVDPRSGEVRVSGEHIGTARLDGVHPGNLACAVGAVMGLGYDPALVAPRLGDLPVAQNRQTIGRSQAGFAIIDDTFNSNPAGARAALARLAQTGAQGRRVMVTPGMVELGNVQRDENLALARDAAAVVTDLVIVGRTNRRALLDGAAAGGLTSVIVTPTREEAVAWVRDRLGADDAVLYENDLPDHYP